MDKWLHVVSLAGAGETEVIRLEVILMDDRLAVGHARSLGIRVPTAIYLQAKTARAHPERRRLSEGDLQAVLGAADEGF